MSHGWLEPEMLEALGGVKGVAECRCVECDVLWVGCPQSSRCWYCGRGLFVARARQGATVQGCVLGRSA